MERRDFLKKVGTGVLVAGALPYLSRCEINNIEPISEGYVLKDIKSKVLSKGLESPAGLSVYKNFKKSSLKSASNPTALDDLIFCDNPVIIGDSFNLEFVVPPKIYQYIGDTSTTNVLYEFQPEDINLFSTVNNYLVRDEQGDPVFVDGKPANRPFGLTLDTLVLPDTTPLFSSILSNKLFKIGKGTKETYLEDDELFGINNMIYGSDGKIHCTQADIYDSNNNLIRQKRILSIDPTDGSFSFFDLPFGLRAGGGEPIYEDIQGTKYAGGIIELGSQLRIVENTNPLLDSSNFYAIDQFSRVLHKISSDNKITSINLSYYPSGLAIDNSGRILISTTFILKDKSNDDGLFASPPQLVVINPSTEEENILYSFGDAVKGYHTQIPTIPINFQENICNLPWNSLRDVSAIQNGLDLDLYWTDSVTGEVGELNATIAISP